jgi:glycosyltransferase involved in cell wall biosynthesis
MLPAGSAAPGADPSISLCRPASGTEDLGKLLDSIAALRRRSGVPFHVVFVGDGPEKESLRQRGTAAGLDDIVTWHGWLDKQGLLKRYRQSDCLLNPSLAEGMPNAVLEAMACGLPVIASDVVGNNAVVAPGDTGLLVDLSKTAGFASAMQQLLADPALSRAMGAAGRQRAEARYSWQSASLGYVSLLGFSPACAPGHGGHASSPRTPPR